MFAIFRELDGDMGPTSLNHRSKSLTTMAASLRDATLTELFPKCYKITAYIAQRACIFYVTSFWTSKLFRTSGFLVLLVQLFPDFHHCKTTFKKAYDRP